MTVAADFKPNTNDGPSSKSLDDFLNMGRYSLLVAFLLELMILNQAGNLFFMVFAGAPPTVIGCQNQTTFGLDETELCNMYHNGTCEPVLDYQFHSVNVDWNHVCADGKTIKDSTSYQMAGYILGSIFIGQISDTYGRKWPMFICLLATFVIGIGSAFSPNLHVFTISRTLISFFNAGHIVITTVFMCESFPKKHRMWITFILSWSPNMILLTGIAYLCHTWQAYSIVLNVLAGVACVILLFVHESCYWLVRMGKTEEAEATFKKIAKFDGRDVDEYDLNFILDSEKKTYDSKEQTNYSYQHLFYTWNLASYTFAIGFSYFAVSVVHYAILFNIENIPGSMYYNMIFFGVVRFVLNIVSAFAEYNFTWLGRKATQLIFSSYASLTILMILLIQVFGYEDRMAETLRFLAITGGSVSCQLYAVDSVSSNEVFPTPIRNIAYAVVFLSESAGTALGPQIYGLNAINENVPFITMFVLCVAQAVFYNVFIPETKGKPLADKMPNPDQRIFRRPKTYTQHITEC